MTYVQELGRRYKASRLSGESKETWLHWIQHPSHIKWELTSVHNGVELQASHKGCTKLQTPSLNNEICLSLFSKNETSHMSLAMEASKLNSEPQLQRLIKKSNTVSGKNLLLGIYTLITPFSCTTLVLQNGSTRSVVYKISHKLRPPRLVVAP